MTFFSWFRRSDDDAFVEGYRLGLEHGMDDYRRIYEQHDLAERFRLASASYPDDGHENVVSLARHRSWIPRGAA